MIARRVRFTQDGPMISNRTLSAMASLFLILIGISCATFSKGRSVALFPKDGVPEGWTVRHWADVGEPPKDLKRPWVVENGVLVGSDPRGTWLVSEREYGDFILEFDWKIGERGNSGCGVRFPAKGDPAFDGIEIQMVDTRYFTPEVWAKTVPEELTGGLYRAVAPTEQRFRPMAWNHYRIECRGDRIRVALNGAVVQDVDLSRQTRETTRHDGRKAPALKDRPRRGRIGFQELSRSGRVEIRGARIQVLD